MKSRQISRRQSSSFRALSWALVSLSLALLTVQGARASSIAVTRFDDPAPDACAPDDCSLREAIISANASPGPDDIVLLSGTYTLEVGGRDEDGAMTGDLDIVDDLTIEGTGPDSTVVAALRDPCCFQDRVFDILTPTVARISGLTITDVSLPFPSPGCGGGIRNSGTVSITNVRVEDNIIRQHGGGICNHGTLTITDSTVSNNRNVFGGNGGGIYNTGVATLTNVTVAGNLTDVGDGSGIYNSGILTVSNSTISGNELAGSLDILRGGGIANSGTATLTNVTIAGNQASTSGGGIRNAPDASITLINTIVANNIAGNCDGSVISQGHNLSSDDSCGFTSPGDLSETDPRLGPLADNGGLTQTHALLAGSPAIDAADNAACPTQDQRGVARPQGDACDIGAYEAVVSATPTPTLTPTPPPEGATPTPTPSPTPAATPPSTSPAGLPATGSRPSEGPGLAGWLVPAGIGLGLTVLTVWTAGSLRRRTG